MFNASYLPYQYPLFFPNMEGGYRPNVTYRYLEIFDDNKQNRLAFLFVLKVCHKKQKLSYYLGY